MDTQMKKGLCEVCVLRCVQIEESYGYQILSSLQPFLEISESTLYPILKRLEVGGALVSRTQEYCGRLRKYYSITTVGVDKLEKFKKEQEQMEKIYAYVGVTK